MRSNKSDITYIIVSLKYKELNSFTDLPDFERLTRKGPYNHVRKQSSSSWTMSCASLRDKIIPKNVGTNAQWGSENFNIMKSANCQLRPQLGRF